MNFYVSIVLTVFLDAGAAMTCWIAWTTVMKKTAARVRTRAKLRTFDSLIPEGKR